MRLFSQTDGEVIIHGFVVQKRFFDHDAALAHAKDEVTDSMMGIELHDVPEDRAAADVYQGFGAKLGFFAKACSDSAT
jgi:hypothetical protein